MLGPESLDKQWNNVIRKACDTTRRWANLHSGFFYNVLACNVYILPLFSYVGQLASTNLEVVKCSNDILSSMFTGPGGWLPRYFLCSMTIFGFPAQIRCLEDSILASKIRVANNIEIDVDDLSTTLGLALRALRSKFGEYHKHSEWHENAFVCNLALANRQCRINCESSGFNSNDLVKQKEGRWIVQQNRIMKYLDRRHLPSKRGSLIESLRKRLSRIVHRLHPLPIRHAADRAYNRLNRLHKLVKPAVQVVYFRTLLNGWVTSRRMRTCNAMSLFNLPPCPMCGLECADSLEHVAGCKVTLYAFQCMRAPIRNMTEFLALDHSATADKVLARRARALSIVYTVYNTLSHHCNSSPPMSPYLLIRAACTHR